MPFKHLATDKNGKIHQRVSADRQYAFAVVRHWDAYHYDRDGVTWGVEAGSAASWSSRRDLAEACARQDHKRYKTSDVEIIPVTPIATGKHKVPA